MPNGRYLIKNKQNKKTPIYTNDIYQHRQFYTTSLNSRQVHLVFLLLRAWLRENHSPLSFLPVLGPTLAPTSKHEMFCKSTSQTSYGYPCYDPTRQDTNVALNISCTFLSRPGSFFYLSPFQFILKFFRFFRILLVAANKIHTLELLLFSTSFVISMLFGNIETEKIGSFSVTCRQI